MLPLPVIRERQTSNTREPGPLLVPGIVIGKRVTGPSVIGGGTGQAGACHTACGSGNWGPELTGDVSVT